MLAVAIPAGLGTRLERLRVPKRLAPVLAAALIAFAPLAVEAVLRAAQIGGSPYPEWVWVAIYAGFAAYLIAASTYVADRLRTVGPWIDKLLNSPEESEALAKWVRKSAPRGVQYAGCALLAVGIATVVEVAVHQSKSDLPARLPWLLGVAVAMFFAIDAVSWVVRFTWLLARLRRPEELAVQTAVPVLTPAIRVLRDFSATLAAVTGVGLCFFSVPLLWLIVHVRAEGVDGGAVRTWSLVGLVVCAGISLYAAAAPQLYLALVVGRQRDRILDAIDGCIPKGDHEQLFEAETEADLAKQRALFDAIAATRTSTIGVTSVVKWALGLLAPVLPFAASQIAKGIGLSF
jgi:hypothetical protein